MKAISPLIATVILVAFTITAAIIVTGALTSMTKSQTETATKGGTCPTGALDIVYMGCPSNTIKVTISNLGRVDLQNFTIFADVNGQIYSNSTPVNSGTTLKPADTVTLEGYTAYDGAIAKLRVTSGGTVCPGVYTERTNDTLTIGTC